MTEFLKHVLNGQNQFASGGLLLMIVGGLGVWLRAIPLRAWHWLVEQSTLMVTVNDEDAAFVWVKEWFLEQKFLKSIRRVDLDTTLRGDSLALVPAPGTHWFWYGGRPFIVYFYRTEDTKGFTNRRSEGLTFRTIGRRQSFLKQFVKEIVACHEKNVGDKSSLFVHADYWDRVQGYVPRALESVILRPGEKERLLEDVEKFKNARQRYRHLGVPYHRGYLLYGPPGTGKTSLVSAIAEKFAVSIYAINLADFNDRSLMKAINDVPPGSVVLFEDIDCMKGGKARESVEQSGAQKKVEQRDEKKADIFGVTLSGLLNVLDGFHTPDNVLFMMTSNHIDALDPALLRPGRIDYRLYLGAATDEQKVELYLRFFPRAAEREAYAFVDAHAGATTMAEFQGTLLAVAENRPSLDTEASPDRTESDRTRQEEPVLAPR
ncbi:MAG TPA: AAA family ATPase [Candidatus Binatus sp.]|nr:AAA family ATPase [Candidatus Binatus sp.]